MRYMLIGDLSLLSPIAAPNGGIHLEGAIDDQDPQWARPSANCGAAPGADHFYETWRIINNTGEAQVVDILAGWNGDGFLHVFSEPFDPANLDTCLAGNDDFGGLGGSRIGDVAIEAGQVLVIVASTFRANNATGAYTLDISTVGPPPIRPNLMRCGNTNRDVSTFVSDGVEMEVVDGCAPDGEAQALLVSRTGAVNVDGDGLRTYLEGGGIAITEFVTSDEVYNAVFPEANVAQGRRNGQCSDNINPPVRLNLDDAFWVDNADVAAHEGGAGCGHDISAFPNITPLGGWNADTVSLAYIDVGNGRLWLVESDWQDNAETFTAESLALMQYMVLNRR
jgi:hypothetical protein